MNETEDDVMQRDEQGYVWLVASELIPFVPKTKEDVKETSLIRKIEHWCEHGRLKKYAFHASHEQQLQLIVAGRIKGFSSKERPLYLIHRDGLAHLDEPLIPGRIPKNR